MWRRTARLIASLLAAAELATSVLCPAFAETVSFDTSANVYETALPGMDSLEYGEMEDAPLPEEAVEETDAADSYQAAGEVFFLDRNGTASLEESQVLDGAETADSISAGTEEMIPSEDAGVVGAEEDESQEALNEGYAGDGEEAEALNQDFDTDPAEAEAANQDFDADPTEAEAVDQGFTEENADPVGSPEGLSEGLSEELNENSAEEGADPQYGNGDEAKVEIPENVISEEAEQDGSGEMTDGALEEPDSTPAEADSALEETDDALPEAESNILETDGSLPENDRTLLETAPLQETESEEAMKAGSNASLSEPSGLSVSKREDGDYTLSWKPVSGASGYQIYVYNKPSEKWVKTIYRGAAEGTSYIVSRDELGWGETRYTLSAVDASNQESTYGKNAVSIYLVPKPDGWLDANYSECKNSYTFYSSYDKTQVSGVEIYRSLDSGSWTKIRDLSVSNFEETYTSVEDSNITKAGSYSYRARFYYTVGSDREYGDYSKTVKEKIPVQDADGIYAVYEGTKVRVKISSATYWSGAFDSLEVYRKYNSSAWAKIKTIKRSELQIDNYWFNTEFTDSLSESGTYQYRYRFCLGTSGGKFSGIEKVYYLKNPVIRSFTTKDNKIILKWAGDAQATTWYIELADYKTGNLIKQFNLAGSKTAYTIDLNKVEYIPDYYSGNVLLLRICADNKNTTSNYSIRKCIFLGQPKIRGSVSTSSSSVGLTWKKIAGASGYKVYRYNTGKKKYELIGTVKSASKTSFADKKRKAKTKYTYRIRAYRKIGSATYTSALSNVCDVWTLPKKSAVKIVNTLAGKKVKPQIRRRAIRVNDLLRANGNNVVGGDPFYASDISDFIDYKGYYTIAYPMRGYLIIKRMKSGNLKVVKTLKIKMKYPMMGGVICDTKGNYYVAWGDSDDFEKGSVVTFALSKYSYNGKHKGTCAYKGKSINTKSPFEFGNCAMTIDKSMLICHFARIEYKLFDGKNHQASQYCIVNTKTMKKENLEGYDNFASHSFDQRILTRKGGGVLYTDLGDGSPRGIQLHESGPNGMEAVPFHFYGKFGDNIINAFLGDVVELSTGYMVVGVSGKSLKSLKGKKQLFIQIVNPVTGKSVLKASTRKGTCGSYSVKDVGVKWLTNYTDGSGACNVQATAADGDRVVIMWQREDKNYRKTGTYYMVVSASGTVLQKATRIGKNLETDLNSNEELKYNKGNVYWSTYKSYSSRHQAILTHKLNVTAGMGVIPDEVVMKSAKISGKGTKVSWKKVKNATQYYVYRKTGKNGKWKKLTVTKSLSCTDKTAKAGKTYFYTVKGYNTKKKVFGDMDTVGVQAK